MAPSKYKVVSGDAKCPYYTYETSQFVHCSPITYHGKVRVVFDHPTICQNYKRDYCHSVKGWEKCKMAKMFGSIWEENENDKRK